MRTFEPPSSSGITSPPELSPHAERSEGDVALERASDVQRPSDVQRRGASPQRYPVTVIAGPTGSGKSRLLNELLSLRPPEERWAVLLNDGGNTGVCPVETEEQSGVAVRDLSGACVCCTGQVVFVTALATLVRQSKPSRVFLEVPPMADLIGLQSSLKKAFGDVVFVERVVLLSSGLEAAAVSPHQRPIGVPTTLVVRRSEVASGDPSLSPPSDSVTTVLGRWPSTQQLRELLLPDPGLLPAPPRCS